MILIPVRRGSATRAALLSLALVFSTAAPAQVITTIAGGGAGDGNAATNAPVIGDIGLAFDGAGNLYIADSGQNRIRKIDKLTGTMTTVAGNGTFGNDGSSGSLDVGLATQAAVGQPKGIALDSAGNIYFSVGYGGAVRRVDAVTGMISTVAAGGLFAPEGIAFDEADNLYIADKLNHRVRKVEKTTGIVSTVISENPAQFEFFYAGGVGDTSVGFITTLAYEPGGFLLVADAGWDLIRRINLTTRVTTVVAGRQTTRSALSNGWVGGFNGDGSALGSSLNDPYGVARNAAGDLFIADTTNHRVRRVSGGTITTIAGNGTAGFSGDGGLATAALVNSPRGIAVDADGNVVFVDTLNYRIRRIDAVTGNISTIAGTGMLGSCCDGGQATNASVSNPSGVAINANAGMVYIADTNSNRIRRIDENTGLITTAAGTGTPDFGGDGGAPTNASLNGPRAVALDQFGNLFIADTFNHRIRKVDFALGTISTVAGNGVAAFAGDGGQATSASLSSPNGIEIYGNALIIADTGNARIRSVDLSTGIITTIAGDGTGGAIGGDPENGIIPFAGDGPALSVGLYEPTSIASNPGRPSDGLYIVDRGYSRVFNLSGGVLTTIAGNGDTVSAGDGGQATAASFTAPFGVMHDGGQFLYVSDTGAHNIRRIYVETGSVQTGTITTFAGDGVARFAGDGGLATTASLNAPMGIANYRDSVGYLIIADRDNGRIRVTGQSSLTAQTIAFTALPDRPASDPPFAVNATATSNLAVAFSTLSPAVCTVSGNVVTLVGAGACTIRADQAGNTSYSAALPVTQSFNVTAVAPDTTPDAFAFAPQANVALSSTTTSAPAQILGINTAAAVSVSGGSYSIGCTATYVTAPGNVANGQTICVQHTSAATANASVTTTLTVGGVSAVFTSTTGLGSQVIAFGGLADRALTSPAFAVTATGGASGNPVTFQSLTPAVCTLSTNTVTLVAFGTCSIAADQAGNANYNPAPQVTQSFVVTIPPKPAENGSVAAGSRHTCAVTTRGGVKCWGDNSDGQLGETSTTNRSRPAYVSGLKSGITAVTAGYGHSCALTTGGGVKCWGRNDSGQLGDGEMSATLHLTPIDVPGLTSGVVAISAGQFHTCALTGDGTVKCWGANHFGQLGLSGVYRPVPSDVPGLPAGAVAIEAGDQHTCALTTAGAMKCWGSNANGRLGDNSTVSRATPADVSGFTSGATAITAGGYHSCAVTIDRGARCWGWNESGQLGDDSTAQRLTPVDVSGLTSGVAAITAGANHTCAITSTSGVKCWGYNAFNLINNSTTVPVDVPGLVDVVAIAAGALHTCAMISGGDVKCWMNNIWGQLGDGLSNTYVPFVVDAQGLNSPDVLADQAINFQPIVDRSLDMAPIALNAAASSGLPIVFSSLTPAVCAVTIPVANVAPAATYVASGTCTIAANQVGNDNFSPAPQATQSFTLFAQPRAEAIAAGTNFTCALVTGGATRCWGANDKGQLGDTSTADRPMQGDVTGLNIGTAWITAGAFHACAITAGGGGRCWGWNQNAQLGSTSAGTALYHATPLDVTGMTSGTARLSAGAFHTCAQSSTGVAKCWGLNNTGQLGVGGAQVQNGVPVNVVEPTNVLGLSSNVTAITTGSGHSCAIVNGGAKCWGDNGGGQIGDASINVPMRPFAADVATLGSGVAAIAAGASHSCALTTAGGVKCWGDNSYRQVGDGSATAMLRAPVDVSGLTSGVSAIAVGAFHTCALTVTGGVKCWGSNVNGQIGDGSTTLRPTPVDVAGLAGGVVAIAAGASHTCAILQGGSVKCWGDNSRGQLGEPSGLQQLVPVFVTGFPSTDETPDPFSFPPQFGVTPSSTVTSAPVTIVGFTTAPVSVSGGSYSIGCTEPFITTPGAISGGQTICLRHSASAAAGGSVVTTLSIGSVSASFTSSIGITADQTIDFHFIADHRLNGPPFTVSATASSGLAVTFAAQSPMVCSVTGATVTLHGIGVCIIAAMQSGGAPYSPAPTVTRSFNSRPTYTSSSPAPTGGNIAVTWLGGGPACSLNSFQFIRLTGNVASPPNTPVGVPFPHGLFIYTLNGCAPGSTVTFNVTYPTAFPVGSQYYKYGPTLNNPVPHWYVLPGAIVSGDTVTFSVTDGGTGDDDRLANGTIVDPGGVGTGDAFIVSLTAGPHGSVAPGGAQLVAAGSTASFVLTPDSGYVAVAGGSCGGTLLNGTYTTNTVSADCTVNVLFTTADSTQLTGVWSRKMHGTAGEFNLPIDRAQSIGGQVTVEPRIIGNGHAIVFGFNQPVIAAGTATVTAPSGAVSAAVAAVGNEAIVTVATLPDASRISVSLTGVNGTFNTSVAVGFLVGDVNGSRTVDALDLSAIRARSGQPVALDNFRFDITASGGITSADILAAKARPGASLP